MPLPPDLQKLVDELDAAARDAIAVASGLDEAQGTWRPSPGAWSVAECLDHLAVSNRVYLARLIEGARRGREAGRMRRREAVPGFLGGMFARSLEPPVKRKTKNPKLSTPRNSPPLAESLKAFLDSQEQVRTFIRENADLDLASIRFVNPFVQAIRFSLATGLHVITSHDRRHIWQARNVRQASSQ